MENIIKFIYQNISMTFHTNEKVFSPKNIDNGTLAMMSFVSFSEDDKVLDLGCGYGAVGITAAKLIGAFNITMCDISDIALQLAKQNAVLNKVEDIKIINSNGLDNIADYEYTLILSNPPYHTDFAVPKSFIEKGYKKMAYGGKMYMVTKRKEWYKNKFISVFGGVKIYESNGYYIFMAEKIHRGNLKYKSKEKNK